MSTIDPTLARKARENKRPSNLTVAVLLILQFVGGAAAGYGWTTMMSFEYSVEPPVIAAIAIPVGMMLTIISSIVWAGVVFKRADVGLAYGGAAVLSGGGLGVLASVATGMSGTVALVIGVVLLVLGIVFVVLGAWAAAARRRQGSREEQLMKTGTLVTATVSDQGYTVFHESTRILTSATFTFTDLQGTQRWVQKPVLIHQNDPLITGQETRLWFDAANPSDERSIVVEAARSRMVRR